MQFRRERVRVETERHVVEGTLQLPVEGFRSRTTDYLNAHDRDFIALTDAHVHSVGEPAAPEHHEYIGISVRHIVIVVELETLGVAEDEPTP